MRSGVFGIVLTLCLAAGAWGQDVRIHCDQKIGKIRQGLVGVAQGGNADSYLKPEVVASLKGLNVKCVRMEAVTCNHNYTLYDPATKTYHWETLDREIEAIQSSGAEIILGLFCTPKWLTSDPEGKHGLWFYAGPRDYEAWAEYIRQIVKHVNVDKKYGVKYWEVWNEPSGGYFYSEWNLDKKRFWELYVATARAIKSADPAALVGGFADNPYYIKEYQEFFEYVKPRKAPVDFLTIHWYAEWIEQGWKHPEMNGEFAKAVERLYVKHFGKKVPIFFTEWNLDAEKVCSTPVQQAAYVASSLYWMQESPLAGAMFFRVEEYKGLHRAVLDDKFQWRAPARMLAMFSRLPGDRVKVSGEPKGVTVLAGQDSNRMAAMVSRYDTGTANNAISTKVSFQNCGHRGPYRISVYAEDAASAAKPGTLMTRTQTTGTSDGKTPIEAVVQLEKYAAALVVMEFLRAE